MRTVKVLLSSAVPSVKEAMRLAIRGIERRLGEPIEFLEAVNGEQGARLAWREMPDVVVADEIQSRAGAFSLARDLRNAEVPFPGAIVILLDRPHDEWLARWSGADAWFVKPVDPFALAERVLELVQGRAADPVSATTSKGAAT
jgi:DNA-binding response OmpR family regulator